MPLAITLSVCEMLGFLSASRLGGLLTLYQPEPGTVKGQRSAGAGPPLFSCQCQLSFDHYPSPGPALPRRRPPGLERDAAALYEAATAFIRIYQFRDRDQALRFRLTVVQAYTLDILSTGGQSLTGLARALRLDKSTMSRVISSMAQRGLVEWSRPEHDRRAKQIVGSREGRRRYQLLRRALVRDNARLLASYSPATRRAAITILLQLVGRAESAQRP
jgi:DNA-binding MarR family transcriptional regulator